MEGLEKAISPELKRYYERMCPEHGELFQCDPVAAAQRFREFFDLPCPFTELDAVKLIDRLGYKLIYLQKGFEDDTHDRGRWEVDENCRMVIRIGQDRPPASRVKTLLHEIIEALLMYSFTVKPWLPKMLERDMEAWCNRFAAMAKMPPELFRPAAITTGLDHRQLALLFDDTLAGVSRQIRDVIMFEHPYYFARFEPENNPKEHCPKLIRTLNESNGICVRIWDTVKTKAMGHRGGHGSLPIYNIGVKDHYHVLNPVFRPYIEDPKPIFIDSLVGASGCEVVQPDLFGENHLTVLMLHYGLQRTQGFFLLAVSYSRRELLVPQTDLLELDRRPDIEWLFSWLSARYERPPRDKVQTGLILQKTEDGAPEEDMDELLFLWPHLKP